MGEKLSTTTEAINLGFFFFCGCFLVFVCLVVFVFEHGFVFISLAVLESAL